MEHDLEINMNAQKDIAKRIVGKTEARSTETMVEKSVVTSDCKSKRKFKLLQTLLKY